MLFLTRIIHVRQPSDGKLQVAGCRWQVEGGKLQEMCSWWVAGEAKIVELVILRQAQYKIGELLMGGCQQDAGGPMGRGLDDVTHCRAESGLTTV